jgi:hypothetical protein
MSTITSRPMSLLRVDFSELYARHLCRHSQFGNNAVHLTSLFGLWYGVYGVIYSLVRVEWLPAALAVAYLALVAFNAPARVCAATAVFLILFLTVLFWLPELPVWVYVLMVPVFYKIQAWSHLLFTAETDMTDFNKKYPKGFVMFVVLLICEVPLVLNYLVFDRKHWTA